MFERVVIYLQTHQCWPLTGYRRGGDLFLTGGRRLSDGQVFFVELTRST